MIAVVQRVLDASVDVGGERIASIGRGYLVLLGVARGDTLQDAQKLAEKIAVLRLFSDEHGRMNLDLQSIGGQILSVSQFTLLADTSKGRRPGFKNAEDPEPAKQLWEAFNGLLEGQGLVVARGRFGADMAVQLLNDGPVTILLDSRSLGE